MSVQLLTNVLIGIVLVGVIAFRQLRWRRIDRTGVWRMPAILAVVGLFSLSSSAKNLAITPLDVTLIGVELALAVVIGLIMGRLTVFRTAATPDDKGRVVEAHSGGLGAALWVVMIAVRIGLDVVGGVMGAHLLTATGVILLTVAVNRAASALVMDGRLPKVATVGA